MQINAVAKNLDVAAYLIVVDGRLYQIAGEGPLEKALGNLVDAGTDMATVTVYPASSRITFVVDTTPRITISGLTPSRGPGRPRGPIMTNDPAAPYGRKPDGTPRAKPGRKPSGGDVVSQTTASVLSSVPTPTVETPDPAPAASLPPASF